MRLLIVTGMSGAGITTVLKILEDARYFCVDNLPVPLLGPFVEMLPALTEKESHCIALGLDARSGTALDELEAALEQMKDKVDLQILFMDASDNVLVKRYKETRRSHPMSRDGRIADGIRLERVKLAFLRKRANFILDTSNLLTRELRQEVERIFVMNQRFRSMMVTVLSFGYKYGIPPDADLVFDVRFLPNPYYVEQLKDQTGNDPEVYDYVIGNEGASRFLEMVTGLFEFLLPQYEAEGKTSLVIAVGCTGGKHRSVSIARALYASLDQIEGFGFRLEHRDIGKDRHVTEKR